MIILYSLPNCPNCLEIKEKLESYGYEYEERPMDSAESITELRFNGCFAIAAPVLQVDDAFFEYCDCSEENFFSSLFHVRGDQKEIPEFNETHQSLKHNK